ncbi:MAG: DUF1616 domain-containing protein [Thermoplasmata archaeon]|nr:DUF1616 domain-containing protein [Thermoplasmata archaeon]
MVSVNAAEAVAGLALAFFLPGFGLARATFPEWRFRGPVGAIHLIETVALSLFGSVAITIVVGFGLLNLPVGFQATWSNPLLWEILAGVSVVALVIAVLRGAFSRLPPPAPAQRSEEPDDRSFSTIRELERLNAEERRLRHRLRVLPSQDPERARTNADLERVVAQRATVASRREAELNVS